MPPTLKDLMGSIMAYATSASEQQGLTQLSHALDPDSLLAAGGHHGKHAHTEHLGLALCCFNLPNAGKAMAEVDLAAFETNDPEQQG